MSNGHPPKTVAEWVRYLHTARAVSKDDPDYPDAQEAVRFALQRIRTLNTEANAAEQAAAEGGKQISPGAAAGVGLMHGLSLGAGEPLAGLLAALVPGGQGFAEGAQQYRQGLENVGTQQPIATPAGEVAGIGAQMALPVGQAVQGGTATAAAIPAGRAGVLARFLTGAGQTNVAPALTMGAIQGFSAGGEDPGDLRARLERAAETAAGGAVASAFVGGLGALRVPRWLNGFRREARKMLPKGTPPQVADEMTESAIRQQLAKQGYPPDTHDRIIASWRAGRKTVPPAPPPAAPIQTRPGETVMTRPPPDPLAEPTFMRRGTGRGLSTQAGGRGVGGHSYTGTYPAGTAAGMPGGAPSPLGGPHTNLAQQQMATLQEFLHGATPADLPGRLESLRALGIPIPQNADAQLLQLLMGGR